MFIEIQGGNPALLSQEYPSDDESWLRTSAPGIHSYSCRTFY